VDETREQRRFTLLNSAAMPVWLAMILAPRSALTARIVARADVLLAGLSVAYVAQLAEGLATGTGQRRDLTRARELRAALAEPSGFLTGWTHFVVFDLFVGRWIWQTALREDRGCRLALVCTLFAGPLGLAVFGAQRRSLTA
jgi:hypothetical protein